MSEKDRNTRFFDGIVASYFPEPVRRLLEEASLFYHVPYVYLLPDERLLSEEQIRFFQVDHNWILALLDGIVSIGRNATIDYSHDAKWVLQEYQTALLGNHAIREQLQEKSGVEAGEMAGQRMELMTEDVAEDEAEWRADPNAEQMAKRRREQMAEHNAGKMAEERLEQQDNEETNSQNLGTVTGFLLNSVLTMDYRGLEFKAYDREEKGQRMTALRIEMLGNRLLLGLFRGTMKRLEICQPPEGLHYGCRKEGSAWVKPLRSLQTGVLYEDRVLTLTRKEGIPEKILDITKTAADMAELLQVPVITSAELAVELIQNAQSAVYILKEEKGEGNGPD